MSDVIQQVVEELQTKARGTQFLDPEMSLKYLTKAILLKPDSCSLHAAKGEIYLSMGDIRGAIMYLRRAYRLDSTMSDVKKRLSIVADALGCIYLEKGDMERALAHFNEAIYLEHHVPTMFIHRALAFIQMDQFEKAVSDFNSYIDQRNDNIDVYIMRGKLHWQLGQREKATNDFEQAAKIDPNHIEISKFKQTVTSRAGQEGSLAASLMLTGDYEKALSILNYAISFRPEDLQLRLLAAKACRVSEKLDLALEHIRAAKNFFASVDSNSVSSSSIGGVYFYDIQLEHTLILKDQAQKSMARGAKFASDAIAKLSEAIVMTPKNTSLYIARGDAYLTLDNLNSAKKDYLQAASIKETSKEIGARLAMVHYYEGILETNVANYASAIKHFNLAIEKNPSEAEYYSIRADAYAKTEDLLHAQEDFSKALLLDPNNSRAIAWNEMNKIKHML